MEPYSGDSSWDLLTSSSQKALQHLKLDCPSSQCQMASAMAWTSSRCRSWTCLTASSMARFCSLTRASSQTFSLLLVIMRVWVCHTISVSILSSVTSRRPSVSVMSLSSNSEPAGCPEVTGSAEVVIAVKMPAAHSSSMVYIFCRVADSQQKGMGYPPMWALHRRAYAMHSNFFMTSSWICVRLPGLGLPTVRLTSLASLYTSERKLPIQQIWLLGSQKFFMMVLPFSNSFVYLMTL